MNQKQICRILSILLILIAPTLASADSFAYVPNFNNNSMSVIDVSTNLVTTTFPLGNGPFGVAASPLGRVYVTNVNDKTVSVIDTATYTVRTISIDNTPSGIAVSPDGSRVYVGYYRINNASLTIIDTSTNNITAKIDVGSDPWGIVVDPSGSRVYVVNRYYNLSISYGTVVVVNVANNSVITNVPVGNDPLGIAISPSGKTIYTVGDPGYVHIIDAFSNTVVGTIPVAGFMPWGIAVNHAGTRLYVVSRWCYSSGNGNVAVINTTNNNLIANVEVGFGAIGISVGPNDSKIYVANSESGNVGSVSVIDASSNTVSDTIKVGRGPVAFGQFILSTRSDTTPPIIALNGDNPITTYIGSVFTDPGAMATDDIDGPVPVATTGSVDTNDVGIYTITYTATDAAKNSASITRTVKVIYNFTGFFQPIDNLPTWNSIKAGSAAPVKFSLNGSQGLDIFAGYPASQNIVCDSSEHVDPIEYIATAGSSGLSYNATIDQYSYIWKTNKEWKNSCRQLIVLLKDGTYHNASFNLK